MTFSPNPMSNKTLKPSLEPIVISIGKSVDRPMTKTYDVSQSKNLTIIATKLEANVEDQKVILKAKVDVALKKKNAFKIGNLKVAKDYEMITYP
jgi:hypothetical protein